MADDDTIEIEVKFVGERMISVRKVGELAWLDITPGGDNLHPESGWEYDDLRKLGEDKHTVTKKRIGRR